MRPFLILAVGVALTAAAAPREGEISTVVLARAVERGDMLSAADLAEAMLPAAQARSALSIRDIEGMAATRRLAAGSILRASDVGRPQIVKRGEPVTIIWAKGALTITSSGRALAGGAQGDLVRVVATATSRTLDATVEGAGAVRMAAN